MEEKYKNKVYILTFILDIFLIFCLFSKKNVFLEKIWIYSILFCHTFFIYAVSKNNEQIIDFLHYLIPVFCFLSLFLKSIFIKGTSLFIIIMIQFLWIYENKCILNNDDEKSVIGKIIDYVIILFTVILSMNIGSTYSKNTENLMTENLMTENLMTEKNALKKQLQPFYKLN